MGLRWNCGWCNPKLIKNTKQKNNKLNNQEKKKSKVYAPAPDLIRDPTIKSDKPRLALL